MKKRISLRIELVVIMLLSILLSFSVAFLIRQTGIGFGEKSEEARISKVHTECIDEVKEQLLKCDLENTKAVQQLLQEQCGFLVGYEFYLVEANGNVIIGSNAQVSQINEVDVIDGLQKYSESDTDKNVFRLQGCAYLKENKYLYYSYLKYDEDDTGMIVAAMLGALVLFLLLIWGRISYISRIRRAVTEIACGDLSCRVPKQYQNELCSLAEDINYMADALENEEQKKNEFLTNISHDVRTPLTTILGYLDILREEKYDSKEELNEYLEIMERKGRFLANMLENFFQYSKLASGDRKLDLCAIELNELLRQFYEDEENEFMEKGLQLHLDLHEQPIRITADMELLVRVVNNLLGNAVKYAKQNTTVYLRSGVIQDKHEAYGYFSMENIPKEPLEEQELERLFERLYKRDSARSEEGSGLGLSIAQNIIKLHGGNIQTYLEGEYLVFRVLLKHNA